MDFQVPIIMGRPFLALGRELVDMELGHMKFCLNDELIIFNVCRSMRKSDDMRVLSLLETIGDEIDTVPIKIKKRLGVKALAPVIMIFYSY